jgi:hypothetical protein
MSQASYIIICAGRGEVEAAKDMPEEAMSAAMNCAARLVAHVELSHPEPSPEIETAISAIATHQHAMMEALPLVKRSYAEELITEMFRLLDNLESAAKQFIYGGSR